MALVHFLTSAKPAVRCRSTSSPEPEEYAASVLQLAWAAFYLAAPFLRL